MGKYGHLVGGLRPRRNKFDLSYRVNGTCDMGQLIPIYLTDVIPADTFSLSNEIVCRMQPLRVPIMHEITISTHYFFVPYRILWDQWEDWIASKEGTDDLSLPSFSPTVQNPAITMGFGSLWDFFGFPIVSSLGIDSPETYQTVRPNLWPWMAYSRIYNDYYRDQNLQQEIPIDNPAQLAYVPLNRNWRKDYFTSALPFRQAGQAPAFPVDVLIEASSGITSPLQVKNDLTGQSYSGIQHLYRLYNNTGPLTEGMRSAQNVTGAEYSILELKNPPHTTDVPGANTLQTYISGASLEYALSGKSATFNVHDMRLTVQLQKWLERNARGGRRYTEFLRSHFGVSPSDSRLDRPEYIGGTKQPLIISEVVQTGATGSGTTPQGTMVGHGLAADGQYVGKYHVEEYGLIMGILSIMPKPSYQTGINRAWLRDQPTDYYFPEFAHLSEQAVLGAEIFYTFGKRAGDIFTFGYQGQYDEYRTAHDIVCNEMRRPAGDAAQRLNYWNLTRVFDVLPNLNSEFITCVPDKRIFEVQNAPGIIYNVRNNVSAVRPMPQIAEPGLVDHF